MNMQVVAFNEKEYITILTIILASQKTIFIYYIFTSTMIKNKNITLYKDESTTQL